MKGTQIKLTLDYLQSNDYEMAKEVLGGCDMVKEIFLFSDKCGPRELQKTYDEYAKDLKKLRQRTRISVWKFIKDEQSFQQKKEEDEGAEGET